MFKAVLEKGKSMKSPPVSLRYFVREQPKDSANGPVSPIDMTRLGFIVRKKTGNAVLRNSMRRVLREAFRLRLQNFPVPAWLVFDIMPQASGLTRRTLRLKGEELLERLTAQLQQPQIEPDKAKAL